MWLNFKGMPSESLFEVDSPGGEDSTPQSLTLETIPGVM
jgi:hypothetical protein